MEKEAYLTKLNSYHGVSAGLKAYLYFILKEQTFRKNDRISLKQKRLGDYPLLVEGSVRLFKFDQLEEAEITLFFWYEKEIIYRFEALNQNAAGDLTIQFLEDSIVYSFESVHLMNLMKLFSEFILIDLGISSQQQAAYLDHIYNLGHLTATRRVELLMKDHAGVFNICEIKHIASFLGMDQKTLTRIRSKT
jgi:hypothetical protein